MSKTKEAKEVEKYNKMVYKKTKKDEGKEPIPNTSKRTT